MDYKKFERVSSASLLAASLALGLVTGCSGKEGSGNTFTGTAEGKNGDVTVEVVYDDCPASAAKVLRIDMDDNVPVRGGVRAVVDRYGFQDRGCGIGHDDLRKLPPLQGFQP